MGILNDIKNQRKKRGVGKVGGNGGGMGLDCDASTHSASTSYWNLEARMCKFS